MRQGPEKRVEAVKENINEQILMADAVSLAMNEVAVEHEMSEESRDHITAAVRAEILDYHADGNRIKTGDLKIIAYDAGEKLLREYEFDDAGMTDQAVEEYRRAIDEYFEELLGEER
jgi:hypothetical protein